MNTNNFLTEGLSQEYLDYEKIVTLIPVKIFHKRMSLNMTHKKFATFIGIKTCIAKKWERAGYNFTLRDLAIIKEKLGIQIKIQFT